MQFTQFAHAPFGLTVYKDAAQKTALIIDHQYFLEKLTIITLVALQYQQDTVALPQRIQCLYIS